MYRLPEILLGIGAMGAKRDTFALFVEFEDQMEKAHDFLEQTTEMKEEEEEETPE